MRAVRFTKDEVTAIKAWLPTDNPITADIVAKLDAAEFVAKPAGIGVERARRAMVDESGNQLAYPTGAAVGWYARHAKRIADLGLSETDCRAIVKSARARGWQGVLSFETLIRMADRLLAEAQLGLPVVHTAAPIDMDDL